MEENSFQKTSAQNLTQRATKLLADLKRLNREFVHNTDVLIKEIGAGLNDLESAMDKTDKEIDNDLNQVNAEIDEAISGL